MRNLHKWYPLALFTMMVGSCLFVVSCSNESLELQSDRQDDVEIEKRHYIFDEFLDQITPCEASMLTYYVSDCFQDTDYNGAIQSAMSLYNDAPLGLNWTEVDDPTEADLVFNCQTGACGTGVSSPAIDVETIYPHIYDPGDVDPNVQTTFPSGGTIGGVIQLSTGWTDCTCEDEEIDECFFISTVLHEVGHALGLLHNDPGVTIAGVVEHIDGTPWTTDPTSVFNSATYHVFIANDFCDRPCNFNANDIVALQSLYPEVSIEGPENICIYSRETYCIDEELIGDDIDWLVDGTFVIPISGKESCLELSFPEAGKYTITAIITDGDCQFEVEQTIEVHDGPSEHCLRTLDPKHE